MYSVYMPPAVGQMCDSKFPWDRSPEVGTVPLKVTLCMKDGHPINDACDEYRKC